MADSDGVSVKAGALLDLFSIWGWGWICGVDIEQKRMKNTRLQRVAISLVCGCIYAASLFLNVFTFPAGDAGCIGWFCLLFGFGHLAWYANWLLLVSHKMMLEEKNLLDWIAPVLALAALGLALTTFSITQLPKDEAGNMSKVTGYGAGFYLWMACIVGTIVAQVFFFLRNLMNKKTVRQ